MEFPIRINKYLAETGVTTRRGADAFIERGDVLVNGKTATLGQQIERGDKVTLKGESKKKTYRYVLFNKPRGVITHAPSAGEVDIESLLKEKYNEKGLFPIGRLEKDTEGAIILTDDGRVTARVLTPEQENEREYHVTVNKALRSDFLRQMEAGVSIEGYLTKPAKVKKLREKQFSISLVEGKKHQLKRMCAALGYETVNLVRVRIMNLELGDMKPGQMKILKGAQLKEFLKTLGIE